MGHTPSTAGTFRKKFRKNSGKTPETLSERFLEFPREYGWDAPNPIIQGIWGFQSVSRILSPPVRLGTPLFSELVPERASQSRSWNSRQYWGSFWEDAIHKKSWGQICPHLFLRTCSYFLVNPRASFEEFLKTRCRKNLSSTFLMVSVCKEKAGKCENFTGPIFIHPHPPTPEKTLLGVGGV